MSMVSSTDLAFAVVLAKLDKDRIRHVNFPGHGVCVSKQRALLIIEQIR